MWVQVLVYTGDRSAVSLAATARTLGHDCPRRADDIDRAGPLGDGCATLASTPSSFDSWSSVACVDRDLSWSSAPQGHPPEADFGWSFADDVVISVRLQLRGGLRSGCLAGRIRRPTQAWITPAYESLSSASNGHALPVYQKVNEAASTPSTASDHQRPPALPAAAP